MLGVVIVNVSDALQGGCSPIMLHTGGAEGEGGCDRHQRRWWW